MWLVLTFLVVPDAFCIPPKITFTKVNWVLALEPIPKLDFLREESCSLQRHKSVYIFGIQKWLWIWFYCRSKLKVLRLKYWQNKIRAFQEAFDPGPACFPRTQHCSWFSVWKDTESWSRIMYCDWIRPGRFKLSLYLKTFLVIAAVSFQTVSSPLGTVFIPILALCVCSKVFLSLSAEGL